MNFARFRVDKASFDGPVLVTGAGGCIGSTMYRVSAVVSHTRISTCPGSSSPISLSTVRDWRTTRERYSKSLYQSGGNPISVNAVHEHSEQQMTLCTASVFSSTTRCR